MKYTHLYRITVCSPCDSVPESRQKNVVSVFDTQKSCKNTFLY